ncbi:hypothetical protein DM01DRAFT_1390767 [Hesseltinella vesiculosa]|uniref:Uncharacterized protein n=1 Tax=Hesseltinella vesiculosa TaxID=101127 RepID=A0A1X2GIE5_9FUNG|nr:hypothetical protein DM01DRAFT_1390767 [Hesseltinella vesiculosa]
MSMIKSNMPPSFTSCSHPTTLLLFAPAVRNSLSPLLDHFFSCPSRFFVWWACWRLIFDDPSPTWRSIKSAVVTLSWPPLNDPLLRISPSLLASTIIVGLWRAHWAAILHFVPFSPHRIVSSIHRHIAELSRESSFSTSTYRKLISSNVLS